MMNIVPNIVHVASLKVLTAVLWLMEEKITLPVWHSNAALQQPNFIFGSHFFLSHYLYGV